MSPLSKILSWLPRRRDGGRLRLPSTAPLMRQLRRVDWRRLGGQFLRYLPGAMILLALIFALMTLDFPAAMWERWLPLPLTVVGVALMIWRVGAPDFDLRNLAWLLLILLPALVRAILSIRGPLPGMGIGEALELAVMATVAVGLWFLARLRPWQAWWFWLGALAIAWLVGRSMHQRLPTASPWVVATRWSVVLGLAAAAVISALRAFSRRPAGHGIDAVHSTPDPLRIITRPIRIGLHLAMVLWGGSVGWNHFISQQRLPVDRALMLEAGIRAQEALWMQSVLFGWGHGTAGRLGEVLAVPNPVMIPDWGGLFGLLAIGGLIGLTLLLVWIAFLILHREPRVARPPGPTGRMAEVAAPVALFVAGLQLTGGARSAVVLLVIAGWSALALADVPTRMRTHSAAGLNRRLALALVGFIGVILSLLLFKPTHGQVILRQTAGADLPSAVMRGRLLAAQRANPFIPEIPRALAVSYRKTMEESPGWSETNYLNVVRSYRRAIALDPYETQYPLELARFQLLCRREEEALETVQAALARMPNSIELIDWLYNSALAQNRTSLAYNMQVDGLALAPGERRWWVRRYELTHAQGQIPLAAQALAVALTANPEEPALVTALWNSRHARPENPAIPVTLPDGIEEEG